MDKKDRLRETIRGKYGATPAVDEVPEGLSPEEAKARKDRVERYKPGAMRNADRINRRVAEAEAKREPTEEQKKANKVRADGLASRYPAMTAENNRTEGGGGDGSDGKEAA